jgi:hypothetical protein
LSLKAWLILRDIDIKNQKLACLNAYQIHFAPSHLISNTSLFQTNIHEHTTGNTNFLTHTHATDACSKTSAKIIQPTTYWETTPTWNHSLKFTSPPDVQPDDLVMANQWSRL